MTRAGAESGFTLLELLVVLVIFSLVVAVAMPRIGAGGSRTEARAAARMVVSALRLTREAALGTEGGARAIVDVQARSITAPGDRRPRQLADGLELKLLTARSELREDGTGAVRFFPDGSSTGARIRLESGTAMWLVDVDWLTGAVVTREVHDRSDPAIDDVRAAWQQVSSR